MPTSQSPFDAAFDIVVKDALEEWKAPGISVAVVHNEDTFSKAYGIAEFPNRRMTTDTLFPAASTTKAFTAAATSLVIQDSKHTPSPIDWDTPISSIIPEDFVLADDHATKHTTLEDALSHRSGLASHQYPLIYGDKDATVSETVRSLRHVSISAPPRTKFQYSNPMFIVMTHLLQKYTGEPLGSFLKKRIWDPLGMNETYFSTEEAKKDLSRAAKLVKGYAWIPEEGGGHWFQEPESHWRPNTGGGSIVSNVLDYSRWVRELIHRTGPLKGHDSLTVPRIFHFETGDINLPWPYHAYALGWFVENYRGQHLYSHSGGWPGYSTFVGFLPERKFGFVLMGNSMSARFALFKLAIHLMDWLLGPFDDSVHEEKMAEYFALHEEFKERTLQYHPEDMHALKRELFPSLGDPPIPHTLPLEKYVGTYVHPSGNWVPVVIDGDGNLGIEASHGAIPVYLSLTHASGDFFVAKMESRNLAAVEPVAAEFYIDVSGVVTKIGLDLEPALKGEKIWFTRSES
ncbi:Protein flp [Penicillium rolfsii]|nr:Protein flp [Penicillium rolfsii]